MPSPSVKPAGSVHPGANHDYQAGSLAVASCRHRLQAAGQQLLLTVAPDERDRPIPANAEQPAADPSPRNERPIRGDHWLSRSRRGEARAVSTPLACLHAAEDVLADVRER
jgi:hypothetical protein